MFELRKTLGADYSVNLDDSLRAKKTFRKLGFFKTPSYGLTPYPDDALFGAIKGFQSANGLRRDGIMKPGGETARALGGVLAERVKPASSPLRQPTPKPKPKSNRAKPRVNLFEATKRRAVKSKSSPAFGIFGEIGQGRRNIGADVLAARRALAWTGNLARERALTETRAGGDLFDALKRFQQSAGVKADGWMRPGGETERALEKSIAPLLEKTSRHEGTLNKRAEAPVAGKPTKPWWQSSKLGKVSNYTFSANGRTANYLKTVSKNGDLPFFVADSINTDGKKAVNEFGDLLQQIEKTDPKRARILAKQVEERLDDEAKKYFKNLKEEEPDPPIGDPDDPDEPPDETDPPIGDPDDPDEPPDETDPPIGDPDDPDEPPDEPNPPIGDPDDPDEPGDEKKPDNPPGKNDEKEKRNRITRIFDNILGLLLFLATSGRSLPKGPSINFVKPGEDDPA
jgi:hypothetical protein